MEVASVTTIISEESVSIIATAGDQEAVKPPIQQTTPVGESLLILATQTSSELDYENCALRDKVSNIEVKDGGSLTPATVGELGEN